MNKNREKNRICKNAKEGCTIDYNERRNEALSKNKITSKNAGPVPNVLGRNFICALQLDALVCFAQ
jgi:hypothetical protein